MRELTLRDACRLPKETLFAQYGEALPCRTGGLSFADHGSNVLAVCHLDTVSLPAHYHERRGKAFSPALDDRLGLYILATLLPRRGIQLDLLLTDNEERGASTAADFEPPRAYHWTVSFDRAGSDVVMYQYTAPEYGDLLRPHGLTLGRGSYSDIADLGHLGCAGFNIGAGYHAQHSPACYADLRETRRQVDRFCSFYRDHHATHFPHEEEQWDDLWHSPRLLDPWEDVAYVDPDFGPVTWDEVHDLEADLFYGTEPARLSPRQRAIYQEFLAEGWSH